MPSTNAKLTSPQQHLNFGIFGTTNFEQHSDGKQSAKCLMYVLCKGTKKKRITSPESDSTQMIPSPYYWTPPLKKKWFSRGGSHILATIIGCFILAGWDYCPYCHWHTPAAFYSTGGTHSSAKGWPLLSSSVSSSSSLLFSSLVPPRVHLSLSPLSLRFAWEVHGSRLSPRNKLRLRKPPQRVFPFHSPGCPDRPGRPGLPRRRFPSQQHHHPQPGPNPGHWSFRRAHLSHWQSRPPSLEMNNWYPRSWCSLCFTMRLYM